MRTDLLVNNFVQTAVQKKELLIFEPNFRRNYVHIVDVVNAFIFAIENFSKLKGNIFNLGLSSANLTKLMLAKKIKKTFKKAIGTLYKQKLIEINNAFDQNIKHPYINKNYRKHLHL